jgi:hypothetical protein
MTERFRLIAVLYQPSEYLVTEGRVDAGQMSALPVGKTPEIAVERQTRQALCKVCIEHRCRAQKLVKFEGLYRSAMDFIPSPTMRNNACPAMATFID